MTKTELFNQIKLDFANVYSIPVDELGDNFIAESGVLATLQYQLFLRLSETSQNVWPATSDVETLIIVGKDKLGRTPFPAESGIYICSTIAVGVGGTIDEGTKFLKDGYVYESLSDVSAGDPIQVRALTAGTESALIEDDILTSESALSIANDTITVTSIDTNPQDAETVAEYRADVVNSFTLRPNGGNASDYILWAGDVAEIRTVYPYAADGEAGKIVVYCEGLSPDFIPNAAIIDEVIDAIKYDLDGVGRVLVDLFPYINTTYIVPVQITDINIELTGGVSGEQSEAETVIEDYLLNKRPYLATLNKTYVSTQDTITLVEIINALSESGITFIGVVLKVKPLGGAETTVNTYKVGDANDPTYYGEIPVLETLTIS